MYNVTFQLTQVVVVLPQEEGVGGHEHAVLHQDWGLADGPWRAQSPHHVDKGQRVAVVRAHLVPLALEAPAGAQLHLQQQRRRGRK